MGTLNFDGRGHGVIPVSVGEGMLEEVKTSLRALFVEQITKPAQTRTRIIPQNMDYPQVICGK